MQHLGETIEGLRRVTVGIRTARGASSGSGVVWTPDGRIVTNAHVVNPGRGRGSDAVEVEFWDGRRTAVRRVERSRRFDLARLTLSEPLDGAACARTGDSTRLRPGEIVVAVGNPLGFTGAASSGVIRAAPSAAGIGGRPWVVSQLRLAPGNSGGPLATARGEVVGINTMAYGRLALSIPAEAVTAFLEAAARSAPEVRLGVRVTAVRWNRRDLGFLVREVAPGSPAARASLLPGDVLVGAGHGRFAHFDELAASVAQAAAPGAAPLQLEFVRGGGGTPVRSVAVLPARDKAAA